MMHFKIILETGKKRSSGRTLYVRAEDITDALTISRKVIGSNLISIDTIDYKTYMRGVYKKYDPKHPTVY